MRKTEIAIMTQCIIDNQGGQAYFNLTEAQKILSVGENTLPRMLHEAGITVKRVGKQKIVSAYALAELMCQNRVAPIA